MVMVTKFPHSSTLDFLTTQIWFQFGLRGQKFMAEAEIILKFMIHGLLSVAGEVPTSSKVAPKVAYCANIAHMELEFNFSS